MASSIPPPEPFNFETPENWSKWAKRFDRYISAAGITDETVQVNTLLYAMGQQAEDIILSFNLTADESKSYSEVKSKLDDYFVVRRNVIFERAKFNRRYQGEHESIDSFITDLYSLIEHCGYGTLEEEMLRDRIVVGIKDTKLSENLQANSNLTLKEALDKVRTKELIAKQSSYLRENGSKSGMQELSADAVNKSNRFVKRNFRNFDNSTHQVQSSHCEHCGRRPGHSRRNCPAQNAKCFNCNNFGHFQRFCKKKNVHRVGADEPEPEQPQGEEDDDYYFMGVIDNQADVEHWNIEVFVNGRPVNFKIDTGADVTVISEENVDFSKVKLMKTDKVLVGASGNPLAVVGMFVADLNTKSKKCQENVYVVKNLRKSLLGKPAIKALNVISFSKSVDQKSLSLENKVYETFPKLFSGLGEIEGTYNIKLQPGAVPHAINTPRRVAVPLLPKVKSALDEMVSKGVLRKLSPNDVSPWCAGMVVVPKANGDVRICVDLTNLNKYVIRPRIQLPTVEATLAKLGEAKVFSKLDANSGFYQIKLSPHSQLLTTFLTPFGRYCYLRLPFGVTSGPECFQDKINGILEGLDHVNCQMDDILVDSSSRQNHEEILFPVLQRLQDANITLNKGKCEFGKTNVTFVGQNVGENGISPVDSKVKAIMDMPEPRDIHELRRFMGMCNQLGKFSSNLAELTKPLRELLSKNNQWVWGPSQEESFNKVKSELCSPRVLSIYDPKRETKVSADSSSHGVGAVLLQKYDQEWKPVYYASRSLSDTEKGYAQIEKEALATTWACEKFSDYLIGLDFVIETDHKPLVSLLGKKALADLPPRIVRFRLRLMRFRYKISHIPGKEMYTADTFSRAPLSEKPENSLLSETESYVNLIVSNMPASERKLVEIRENQHDDAVCSKVMEYTLQGWPDKHHVESVLRPYYQFHSEFSVIDGLLVKNDRLVIPVTMRSEILDKIHEGHLGIVKCCSRARDSVWWPGITKQIEEIVRNCSSCIKTRPDIVEPMINTPLPELPWEKVGVDLGYFSGENYLIVVDYYSRFIEMCNIGKDVSTENIIMQLKIIFARFGIPCIVRSDNGPQFANSNFQTFSESYGFTHVTSSPRYPTSNGEVERAVQTVKNLLKRNNDPYLGLLSYRNTKLQNGYSPAELLLGRRLRTTLPVPRHTLKPKLEMPGLVDREERYRERMKENFDRRHAARHMPLPTPNQSVIVKTSPNNFESGNVIKPADTPRSHIVEIPSHKQILRRNNRDIKSVPAPVTTRSGRVVKVPEKLDL